MPDHRGVPSQALGRLLLVYVAEVSAMSVAGALAFVLRLDGVPSPYVPVLLKALAVWLPVKRCSGATPHPVLFRS
jgi:hypothetical protein